MSHDDEGRPRFPRRVTLKWDAPPLRLPDEAPPAGASDIDEVARPDAPEARRPTATPPDPARRERSAADAWERQGSKRTPQPLRLGDGGALDLVERRSRPTSPTPALASEMHDRFALGDYTAALSVAELLLGQDPGDSAAARVAASCRARLGDLYRSRLGSLSRVPRVTVDASEMRWLGLDHRAAFLLSRVDGVQTLGDVLDVSGMPALEALKTLVELLELGAIAVPPREP